MPQVIPLLKFSIELKRLIEKMASSVASLHSLHDPENKLELIFPEEGSDVNGDDDDIWLVLCRVMQGSMVHTKLCCKQLGTRT